MASCLKPGGKRKPLPPHEFVFRLAKFPKDFEETGKASPAAFELSTDDERSELQSISVYATSLTTPVQARELMEEKKPSYRLALHLKTERIRATRPKPDAPNVPYLDVVWDEKTIEQNGEIVRDQRPGAEGHAGITGLKRPENLPRSYYKSLRSQLVEIVEQIDILREIGTLT